LHDYTRAVFVEPKLFQKPGHTGEKRSRSTSIGHCYPSVACFILVTVIDRSDPNTTAVRRILNIQSFVVMMVWVTTYHTTKVQ